MIVQQIDDHKNPQALIPPIQSTFVSIEKALSVHIFFNSLSKVEPPKIKSSSMITLKMRTKLLNWLQRLSVSTFKFSKQTFLTSILVLDQYLQKVDENPNKLQLIGCACLLIASKLKEQIIVDPQCYTTASCNIFTKLELIQKQRILYSLIDWKKIRNGILRSIQKGIKTLNLTTKSQYCLELINVCLKDEDVSRWRQSKIITAIFSIITLDVQKQYQNNQSLNLIKQL